MPLVTGSAAGTLVHKATSGVYGGLQAGSFLCIDADCVANARQDAQPAFAHTLLIDTQVISTRITHAVCDASHAWHGGSHHPREVLT